MYLRSLWHHKGVLGASLNCSIFTKLYRLGSQVEQDELRKTPLLGRWVNRKRASF
jgi:hypothetical protein